MNNIKFASWNIKSPGKIESRKRMEYLLNADWDLLVLQEVSKSMWKQIIDSSIAEEAYCSLDGFGLEVKGRSFGTAILSRNRIKLEKPLLLPDYPLKERAISAIARTSKKSINVLSWHAPNAVTVSVPFKMSAYVEIINWINSVRGPTIMGFDGNMWNTSSSLDLPKTEYDGEGRFFIQHWFYSAKPPHPLKDALIDFYQNNPKEYQRRINQFPDDPLGVSYTRGKTKDRFDYIFFSDDFMVVDCTYDYEGGINAGSDHAYISCSLRLLS